mgnify:CR=1 FL=1
MFELVTESNIDTAAEIHSVSWKESHKGFCSEKFVLAHTKERQRQYIENEIACGKQFYLLVENGSKGIVSIKDNLIENLYVLPEEQRKGYGTKLLKYAEIICTGIPTLWILSNNKAAKNFYQKHGYIFTENKKFLNDELSELEMHHKLDNWFTVEKIDEATYVISEYKHKEETHCYLLIGNEKALLIDTGLGVANIKEVVNVITDLPIMVVVTHVHWDHIGGHKYFDNVAVHENEKEWLMGNFPLPLEIVKRNLFDENCEFPEGFDAESYEIFHGIPQLILYDNDEIDLGNRKVQVIHTPGHSPGHCCFYESERCYLYSGDLVYKGCLDMFYPTTNPELFAQSIRKINELDVRRILPGHHNLKVPVQMISEIEKAFLYLKNDGNLEQGKGLFEFGEFQIHL